MTLEKKSNILKYTLASFYYRAFRFDWVECFLLLVVRADCFSDFDDTLKEPTFFFARFLCKVHSQLHIR
jgi:hypothetical protein